MKFIQFVLIALCFGLGLNVQAQETESTKKVRIVKKMVDENGNETIEEIEAEGEEAERLIQEMDINIEGKKEKKVKIATEKRVEIEIEDEDGDDENVFMLKLDGEDWESFQESEEFQKLPKEVQEELKDLDIDAMASGKSKEKKQEKHIRIKKMEDGEEKIMEWESDSGAEMPEEIKKILKEKGIELHSGHGEKEMRIMHLDKGHLFNRARLGVQIDSEDGKTIVGKVMDDSAAAAAGLEEGDIIQKVNGLTVKNADDLVHKIGKYEPGEHIQIEYQRKGKTKTATAVLKGNTHKGEHKMLWIDDKGEKMEIGEDKDVIIIKKEKY